MSPKNKALFIVLLLYGVSVLCRLPQLNRPLSKHHEFNPATVLIAVEAWQQRGGAAKFGYVPFINYANSGDYMADKRWAIDGKGNGIYLSYGPGMYAIPYWFFTALHLPATPLLLQVLNLLFLLVSVLILFQLIWFLFAQSVYRSQLTIAGCVFFLFNPCILWFLGNGYVNVTISLPFLLGVFYQAMIIFCKQKQSYVNNYVWLALWMMGGMYIDWDVFFAAAVISLYDVMVSIRKKRFPTLALVAGGSALAGILLIVWQYTQYLPLSTIANYWKERFFTRSVEDTGLGLVSKLSLLASNFLWGYLPLFLVIVYLFICFRKKDAQQTGKPAWLYLLLSGAGCLLYNFTFFNWSYIHDFSLVPISIFLIFIPVALLSAGKNISVLKWLLPVYCIFSLAQFYYINRPGKFSQNGTPYDVYEKLGETLKQEVKPDEMIFMRSQNAILNYYAKRFTFRASSVEEAKAYLQQWHFTKGVWVEENDFQLIHIRRIVP